MRRMSNMPRLGKGAHSFIPFNSPRLAIKSALTQIDMHAFYLHTMVCGIPHILYLLNGYLPPFVMGEPWHGAQEIDVGIYS